MHCVSLTSTLGEFSWAKPSDLPVMRAVKVELTINLKTAKTISIRSLKRCSLALMRPANRDAIIAAHESGDGPGCVRTVLSAAKAYPVIGFAGSFGSQKLQRRRSDTKSLP
jgi:hypothetical protein